MNCDWKSLGALVDRKIGYGIVQPGANITDGIPVIKVNNIISGLKSVKELDTTTPENDAKYSRTRLSGGELVISVVGTIGKTAIIPRSFAGCNLVRATALIDIKCEWLTKWVKYYLDSPLGQSYINQNLNTTVQPTLNIKSLVDMPVPFFDELIMRKTVKILATLDDKIELNQKINENLNPTKLSAVGSFYRTILNPRQRLKTLGFKQANNSFPLVGSHPLLRASRELAREKSREDIGF